MKMCMQLNNLYDEGMMSKCLDVGISCKWASAHLKKKILKQVFF